MTDGRPGLAPATSGILATAFGLAGPVLAMAPRGMAALVIAAALLATGAEYVIRRNRPKLPRIALLSLGALILWCAVSLSWDIDPRDGLRKLLDLVLIAASLLALLGLSDGMSPEQRRRCGLALVGGLAIGLILLVIETAFDFPFYRMLLGNSDPKLVDLIESKRAVDALPLLVWPAALALAALGKKWLAILFVVIFGLACTRWTASSATLGMAVSLVVLALAFWSPAGAQRLLAAMVALAFVLVIPVAIMAYDHGGARTHQLKFSGRHRVEIWHFAAEKALERPLFGHGFNASRVIPNGDAVSAFQAPGKPIIPLHPHNAFLQIWLELGFVGVIAVATPLLLALRTIRRWPGHPARFAFAGYAAALVIAGLAFGIWQSWWLATLAFSAVACHALASGEDIA
jgi:O-antigen ligase